MEITSILNDSNDGGGQDVTIKPASSQGVAGNDLSQLDDLTGFQIGQDTSGHAKTHREFDVNQTIVTNDKSAVGDYKTIKATPAPAEVVPPVVEENKPVVPEPNIAETIADNMPIDPAKMDFIKTYTREYDDLVASTTHAVELMLDQIDKTVKEHTSDITIPDEVVPFIDGEKPKDNKVQKFDDAQQIIRAVMDKASQAKKDSEAAAAEASQIYDGIQQFKRDTKDEIADIRNRDEFGHPIKKQ